MIRTVTLLSSLCLAAALVVLIPTDAKACDCMPPSLTASVEGHSDAALVRIRGKGITFGFDTYYRAQVLRTFKGCLDKGETVLLKTASDGAACGVYFQPKQKYLVTASGAGSFFGLPILETWSCDYNVLASQLTGLQWQWLSRRLVCCEQGGVQSCECAGGQPQVQCFVDPCEITECADASECTPNYCGGCWAEFTEPGLGYSVCNPCQSDADCVWGMQVCGADGQCHSTCFDDADCGPDAWCSPTQDGSSVCKPFMVEGDWCGGFTPIWAQSKCAPGLICTDVPPFIADAPGVCRVPCSEGGGCPEGQYCGSGDVCRDMGACFELSDCTAEGNGWNALDCTGWATCEAEGAIGGGECAWHCGDPACQDYAGVFFGYCEAIVGHGVVDGKCTWLSGCSDMGYDLFPTMEACMAACGPFGEVE